MSVARFGVWLVAAVSLSLACTGPATRPAARPKPPAEALPVDEPSATTWPPCLLNGEPFEPEVLSMTGHPDRIQIGDILRVDDMLLRADAAACDFTPDNGSES